MKVKTYGGIIEKVTGIFEVSDGVERPGWISIQYRLNGLIHNENGPAIIRWNGDNTWALNGMDYLEKEWKVKAEILKRWGKG
jgi:hypothetical protein